MAIRQRCLLSAGEIIPVRHEHAQPGQAAGLSLILLAGTGLCQRTYDPDALVLKVACPDDPIRTAKVWLAGVSDMRRGFATLAAPKRPGRTLIAEHVDPDGVAI